MCRNPEKHTFVISSKHSWGAGKLLRQALCHYWHQGRKGESWSGSEAGTPVTGRTDICMAPETTDVHWPFAGHKTGAGRGWGRPLPVLWL